MTPDQMVWHLSQFLEFALGEGNYPRGKMPPPLFLMRPMVLYAPWPGDAAWGNAGGRFASRLQARHFDHHLS